MGTRRLIRPPWRAAAGCAAAAALAVAGTASAGAAGAAAEPARVAPSAPRALGPPVPLALPAGGLGRTRLAPVPELPSPRTGPLPPAGPRATAGRPRQVDAERRRARAGRAADRSAAPTAAPPTTLAAAVARIPGEHAERVRWVHRAYRGHWGAADWYSDTVYISPRTPPARLYSVVVHEYSHLLQARAYDGDVGAAVRAMNRRFGGTGLTGAERAADCMTLLQGGTWTNYTRCPHPEWREAAALLLQGRRL